MITYAKAFLIACAIYTFDRAEGMEEHEDRLYRVVDKMLHLTEDQKVEFYAHLADNLQHDTDINAAAKIIHDKLNKVLHDVHRTQSC